MLPLSTWVYFDTSFHFESETVAKVGVARPPNLQMRNISPRRCQIPLRFLLFGSETADEPVSHAKPHTAL